MTDPNKILNKIKKCMALSSSSNEHETAIALRQAQKLMELDGISDIDVKAAQAEEKLVRAGARHRNPQYFYSSWEVSPSMLGLEVWWWALCVETLRPPPSYPLERLPTLSKMAHRCLSN